MSFDDCLALLDGRFKQLMTLIVLINNIKYHSSNVYNIDDLPNVKYFSLITYYCLSDIYNTEILPLFRRCQILKN
ncbi:unnamed protein product [Rotaria sordida]|uniref:Uncharacterized protein n=1 Tax=Rotaria sordida TaxID=392033 RepID=A0A815EBQ8_9BILA|nr:unnamed protein product [Rotaria sordida]CAF3939123.1 unnamed protein product [Rotaria sordida]